jgi:dolichyl-phosphate-mannose-protein mannosyltransferase
MTQPQTLSAAEEKVVGAFRRCRIPVNSLLAFGLFFISAVLLQINSGAYQGEFTGTNDEAAHFVTGLMVRDYVAAGLPAPPLEYAEDYYRHLPKVGMGHFPPGFHVLQGAWNLVIPPSRASMMLLMAICSALLATLVYAVVCSVYTPMAGIAAGLFWLSLPVNQLMGRAVMADILVALLALIATLAWSRYLERGRVQNAIQFGLIASIALMTKGSAIVFAVVPAVSTLLSGKIRLAQRWSFWLPAVMVVVLCGPWYLLAPGALHEAADFSSRPRRGRFDILFMAWRALENNLGLAPLLLIAVGIFIQIIYPLMKKRRVPEFWSCLFALAIAITLLAHLIIPARGSRHIAFGLAAYVLFFTAGAAGVTSRWPFHRFNRATRIVIITLAATALIAHNVVRLHPVHIRGFSAVAEDMLSEPASAKSILLVSSDGLGEGSLISEIARREPVRPTRVVLRASNLLARDSFSGTSYNLRSKTTEEQAELLRRIPVEFVIIDHTATTIYPHQKLLNKLMMQSPDSWERVGEYTDSEGKPSIEVFRQVDVRSFSGTPMQLDQIPGLEKIYAR